METQARKKEEKPEDKREHEEGILEDPSRTFLNARREKKK